MKTILLAAAAHLLALAAHAQTEQPKIEGLGKLKVGKATLAIIPELEAELKTKVKRAFTNTDVFKAGRTAILELVPDTVSRYSGPIYASSCLSARVYMIPTYKVADIEIKDLKLTFLGNVLIKLECDASSALRDAFKLKYGEGTLKEEEKDIPCTFTYTGNKVVYKQKTYTQGWDSAPLSASMVLHKYYDSNCKEQILNYLLVSDPAALKVLHDCESTSDKRRSTAQDAEKKKKLSDL